MQGVTGRKRNGGNLSILESTGMASPPAYSLCSQPCCTAPGHSCMNDPSQPPMPSCCCGCHCQVMALGFSELLATGTRHLRCRRGRMQMDHQMQTDHQQQVIIKQGVKTDTKAPWRISQADKTQDVGGFRRRQHNPCSPSILFLAYWFCSLNGI